MSMFVDSEAEESEHDGEDEEEEAIGMGISRNKKRVEKRKKQIDSDEEDDDDDDGQVVNDLIDDNPIEEDDSDNESDGSRKRKKSDDEDEFDDRLEDDDYDLLEENLGVKVERKRFKRVRRMDDEESDVEDTQDRGDDREAIANELFVGGSDNEEERPARREEPTEQYASDESDDSETDDFIVGDDGRPITEKRKKRPRIFNDANLQEAQDIFGVDFDFEEFDKYEDEYDEDEEEEDEDEYEDEENQTVRKAKRQARKKRKAKSIYEIYEPHELERAGFTDEDNRIRAGDIPERMQLRVVPVVPAAEDELDEEAEWIFKLAFNKKELAQMVEKQKAAVAADGPGGNQESNWDEDWDAQTSFPAPAATHVGTTVGGEENWEAPAASTISRVQKSVLAGGDENWEDEDWDKEGRDNIPATAKSMISGIHGEDKSVIQVQEEAKPKIIPKIRKALEFMRNHHLEVPFIAFYRKEYVEPELKISDLWKIYRLDARYCQLRTRKLRLTTLFKNMRSYQEDLILAKPDEPISELMRLISEDDMERIKAIKTTEEFRDMSMLFNLYYLEDVPTMKEAVDKKRKEERQREKENAAAAAAAAAAADGEENDEVPPVVEADVEPDIDTGGMKRKIGGGSYSLCKKLGVEGLVKKFGLSPEKFAENLRDNYQRHEVEQYPLSPVETASEFLSERLKTDDEALKAARFMLATQISREPLVRSSVREVFFERATINVRPTKKGMKEIDEAHACYSLKYVKDKPVRDLTGDQFLKLAMAEDDKLITISIADKIKGITAQNYVDEVKQLFNRDEFSKNVQEWNNLRGDVVEYALEKLLYPALRKELRAKLLEDAKEHVLEACTIKLLRWLKVAPYDTKFPDEDDEEWDTSKGIRVLSLAYVPDFNQTAFACIVSHDGEPADYIRLQSILKSSRSYNETDRAEKEADLLALKELIRTKKPHVVVIGGESREALTIQEDLRNVISELGNEDGFPKIDVEILDNQLAKIYATSNKAAADLKEFPVVMKEAISLARRIQDPLIEFSQLCNDDDEILCLRFHPLQDEVSKEELLERLQIQFVNRTNEVGVDINRCMNHPYTSNLAQFICGLGKRKAIALIKTLKHNHQRLENRTQLITVCHMGPKIFINCSGFIKIDTNSLGDSTEAYVEVLDGTRVHPETYEWARKMAVDALEYDDEDANPAGALEEILDAPERLKDLDLDAFAEELERQGFGNKSITLYDIRAELNHRYKDFRTRFSSPTTEELFNTLTKETPETLYIGKLITSTVVGISHKKPQGEQLDHAIPVKNEETGMWQCAFCMKNDFPDLSEVWNHFDANACPGQATGVRIRLDNGISGFIPISKLSDKAVTNPESRVKRGQTIHCRIVKIDVERFSVECTSRTSDLVDSKQDWKLPKDPYYDHETEDKDTKKEEDVKKNKQRQTYIKRVIVHPSFKNISYRESEKIMEQMDQGEVIVRPSSKGADHLTVTWKVADGVYHHIDVKEEGKENAFSLGQSLWIENEEFEDLDEIIARHVNPMASHARDLLGYKYYVSGLEGRREKAEEYLIEEKKKNSNKIHYLLQASKEIPPKFLLSYLPGSKVLHEYITVTPEGYRYRQQNFSTLNQTLKWFKEHFRDPPPTSTPVVTPKTQVARTPYATTPGYQDAMSRVGAPPQNHFVNPAASHTTPHYTTPAQAFTPYSAFTTHTPYTPTAQTPYITPYQTPYQSSTTPRLPNQQSQQQQSSGGFLHPGAVTPGGYKTPQQRTSQQRPPAKPTSAENSTSGSDNSDWRKAAEAWAKSQQRSQGWPSQSRSVASAAPHYGGFGPSSTFNSSKSTAPINKVRNMIVEGMQKAPAHPSSTYNFGQSKSPRSGRESLKSTPRTNFSPRSMDESSLGDETPLHDEN